MINSVAVDLDELDARDKWILESIVDQQVGIEVGVLLVKPLLSRILSSAGSCSFLYIIAVT